MAVECAVGIGSLPEITPPGCGTKLFVIGPDGNGYYIKIEDLWDACPPVRFRQKSWAAPGSGTTATMPAFTWPTDMERVALYYNGLLITETTVGGTDWTASGTKTINYPAGFTGGTLTVFIVKMRSE